MTPAGPRAAPRFLWGVATSSYQLEGAVSNDWTDWESRGRLKNPDERCGRASLH
ncbi:MAG: glycoside hydrolase family 1 protein, partial [Acidobacteriota bacterium]|nr:glycoside hydrolase family 1 protein [Acidobacteriota bacterium]